MRNRFSRSGQRCIAAALAIAALVAAAWFLPPLPGTTITRLNIPESDLLNGETAPIRVFHAADELRQALPAKGIQALPDVDWNSTNVVRVRSRAVGYRTPEDKQARFGTLECSLRLGGTRLFMYLHEPTPYLLYGDVSSVFTQIYREAWFAVPKNARLEWGHGGMAFFDLIFGGLSLLLSIACVVVLVRLRRRSRNQIVRPPIWESQRLSELLSV